MAQTIIGLIPPHKIYVEPFFGGGAVFFKKPKCKIEVINDLNNNLITFYAATRDNFALLKSMVDSTLHSESIYQYAKDIYNRRIVASDIEIAWATWLCTNGSFGASIHGGWKWCNGSSGGHSAIMLRNKRIDFSEEVHQRLADVQISCRDALRVIIDRDSEDTFFYLDPPYPGSNQQHYRGYRMNQLYDLLHLLSAIKGKFILSNYWSQTLKYFSIKNKWIIRVFPMHMNVASLGKRGGVKTPRVKNEILVANYPEPNTLFNSEAHNYVL